MQKRKLLVLFLVPFTLMGCKKKDSKQRENDDPISVDTGVTVDQIEESEYKTILSYIAAKLGSYTSYKSVTEGKTVSAGFIEVKINTLNIKSEYSYTKNESKGLVSSVHEAYYHASKAAYRDNDSGDFSVSSIDDYLNVYGTYPFENSLEGYSIKEDAIKSVTKEVVENDKYTFRVEFDPEKSTNNVKIQMKKIGGLGDYPTFESIEMRFIINNDFTLNTIDLHSKYKAKKGFETKCEQTYRVTFTNYNEQIDVPNLNSIKNLI